MNDPDALQLLVMAAMHGSPVITLCDITVDGVSVPAGTIGYLDVAGGAGRDRWFFCHPGVPRYKVCIGRAVSPLHTAESSIALALTEFIEPITVQ